MTTHKLSNTEKSIKLLRAGKLSVKQIAEQLGVSATLVYTARTRMLKMDAAATDKKKPVALDPHQQYAKYPDVRLHNAHVMAKIEDSLRQCDARIAERANPAYNATARLEAAPVISSYNKKKPSLWTRFTRFLLG